MESLTTTLSSGVVVLAKMYKGRPSAKTFANRSQANKAAEQVGGEVIGLGRPLFVKVPAPKFSMGEGVRLVADPATYMGPVKGDVRYMMGGEYVYEVAHGQGGRKLFRESELATW